MSEEAEPKPWYHFDSPEVKPIQVFGRVWKVWELNILWFLVFILYYLVFKMVFGHCMALIIAFTSFTYLGNQWREYSAKCETPYIVISAPNEGKKLPSREEVAEWAKKNSEYFMAWNQRQYKTSKSWFGQKREDWAEWRHQRNLAKYQIAPIIDPGIEVAVDQIITEGPAPIESSVQSQMIDSPQELDVPEQVTDTQEIVTIVIPPPPIFGSDDSWRFQPRKPEIEFDRLPSFLRTATKIYFGLNVFLFSLALFNHAYRLDLFFWPIEHLMDFVAERLLGDYSETLIPVKIRALIIGILLLPVSLLMIIGYRPRITILLLVFTFVLSILLRIDLANPFSSVNEIALDFLWCFYLSVYFSITFFAKDPDIDHPLLGPQELISPFHYGSSGETLELMKPKRPARRARPLFFYEGVFLLLAMILWPLSLFTLAALASAELRIDMALPSDFNSGSLSGQMFLGILFGLSLISTYIVYKFDREARDAPMYAKEMEAYVTHMEHWININNDFFEREHARLTADLPTIAAESSPPTSEPSNSGEE